ncbi:MAG: glycosyltransferase family 4 protein [Granulosicoccus sp.]|nr:glycosyltransferase family 4 protein [Granulosicoccus sp.]
MDKSIKVAMFAQNYIPNLGGAERQMAALAPLLTARGVEVSIVTRKSTKGVPGTEVVDGIDVYRSHNPDIRALASLLFTLQSIYRTWRIKPDIVHAHELLSPTTAALLAKKLYGIPVVAKILRGGYLGDIDKIRNGKMAVKRTRWIAENMDRFLAISPEIENELEHYLRVPAARIVSIPNGVDLQRYHPVDVSKKVKLRQAKQLPEGPLALFAGRLSEEKNLPLLISTWPQVRQHVPDAKLVIIGEGNERDKLKALAGEGVFIKGVEQDLSEIYCAAEVFVLPSKTEGMSNSLLEAMASGCACVATRVGAAEQLIEHRENGLLCAVDNAEELGELIVEAFANTKSGTSTYGTFARETVEKYYSLETVADRLVDVYRDVLAKT